ncbi:MULTISPECIES: alpha/beta fold hydrolase [unclassified Sphingomonas]|uniref:alpha/beta fold hydrolase n=1 Tax=unclassified Sphingomonas TaxID=196159 RepID=UPI001D10D18C|nr:MULTISPECIES: alpha/beta hydrolase [unclassified Sphingomonas]MCC2979193.1 alpha/beta hydrolase [Sphingomonas sp. IC4-52]MCD2315573.1 alpha/beta hydrolase [Sphingomonas sp. IC-11]
MTAFEDVYWWSRDGLRLHARDYPGERGAPPVLCLPGLTRNARDYDLLARRISARHRVLAIDLRGRGESAYAKDPMSYVPLTYAQDIAGFLEEQKIDRFIAVGTSLGGIVTMLLAGMLPGRIAGALLNDVGPEVDPVGLARVRGHVGRSSTWPTWMHAARAVQEAHADIYPDWGIEDWLAMAKRLYRLNSAGRVVIDYDLKIAEPFRVPGNEAGADLWRALAALGTAPVLVVRGGRSDILTTRVAERMVASLPNAALVTLPGIGHAPTLSEPGVQGAIDRLLAQAAEPAST